jgi:glycosyltransferase involved in cell wall biosynthesis
LQVTTSKLKTELPAEVVYLWPYLEWGGAQIYFLGIIKEVRKRSAVRVIMPKGSDAQLLKFFDNLDVPYEFTELHLDSRPALTLASKLALHWRKFLVESEAVRYLQRFDPRSTVVHIELSPWQSLWALFLLSLRFNVFITTHNSLPPVPSWRFLLWRVKLWAITRCRGFHQFTSNQDAKNLFRPLVSKKFWDSIRVTYTSVDPEEIAAARHSAEDPRDTAVTFDIPSDAFVVLCVGQFIDRKGRWTFLEAAQKLNREGGGIYFVWIANSKPALEDLQKADAFGLGENFRLITSDQVGGERLDLFNLIRRADIFVLASAQEGLPISLLEAMALGIPSISTKVNAIPEAIRHEETGILIEPGDSVALAEWIKRLLQDGEFRSNLARQGSEFVLEKFNEKECARLAMEEYLACFK